MDRAKIDKQLARADERIESAKDIHRAVDQELSKLENQIQDRRVTDSEKSRLQARLAELKAQQDESTTALFQLTQAKNKLLHLLSLVDDGPSKPKQSGDGSLDPGVS